MNIQVAEKVVADSEVMKPIIYTYDVDVRFSDLDPYGHVNLRNYLDIVTTSRFLYLENILSVPMAEFAKEGIGFYAAKANQEFLAPITGMKTVRVRSLVEKVEGARLYVSYEMFDVATATLFSSGNIEFMVMDLKTQRPVKEIPSLVTACFLQKRDLEEEKRQLAIAKTELNPESIEGWLTRHPDFHSVETLHKFMAPLDPASSTIFRLASPFLPGTFRIKYVGKDKKILLKVDVYRDEERDHHALVNVESDIPKEIAPILTDLGCAEAEKCCSWSPVKMSDESKVRLNAVLSVLLSRGSVRSLEFVSSKVHIFGTFGPIDDKKVLCIPGKSKPAWESIKHICPKGEVAQKTLGITVSVSSQDRLCLAVDTEYARRGIDGIYYATLSDDGSLFADLEKKDGNYELQFVCSTYLRFASPTSPHVLFAQALTKVLQPTANKLNVNADGDQNDPNAWIVDL